MNLSKSERAFWLGVGVAAVLLMAVLALVQIERSQSGDDDDDGGSHVQRVPIDLGPQGSPAPEAPRQASQGMPAVLPDFSVLSTDIGAGVNGHGTVPLPVGGDN